MRRDLPVPELPDSELDAERAARWAETRGLGPLARRLRGRLQARSRSADAARLAPDPRHRRRGRRGALADHRPLDVVRALGEQDLAVRTRGVAYQQRGRGAARRARVGAGPDIRERHDRLVDRLHGPAAAGLGARDPGFGLLRGRAARSRPARRIRHRDPPLQPCRRRCVRRGVPWSHARARRDPIEPDDARRRPRARSARRPRGRRAPVLRQHRRDAAPDAPARARRRPVLAERDEVARRSLGHAGRSRLGAPPPAAREAAAHPADVRRRARPRPRLAAAARAAHAVGAARAPVPDRTRARPAVERAPRRDGRPLSGPPRASRSRDRGAADAGRLRRPDELRASGREAGGAGRGPPAHRPSGDEPRQRGVARGTACSRRAGRAVCPRGCCASASGSSTSTTSGTT